ncbi:collagen-like protein, partial [Pseudomonas sp. TNT3]
MRNLCLLAAFISPLACAQVVSVETNSLMRLPNTASTLQLERLEVADYGTLLIPSNVTQVTVGELHLGRDARIAIVPGEQALDFKVIRAQLSEGSQITARGAPGTYLKAARSGRNLNVQIKSLNAPQLVVDARGGAGAPGFVGLDGANGQAPGCTWGQAGR